MLKLNSRGLVGGEVEEGLLKEGQVKEHLERLVERTNSGKQGRRNV